MQMRNTGFNVVIFIMLLLLMSLFSGCASRKHILIDKSGHGDYTSIRAGLSDWVEGQPIYIKPGVYDEQIILKTFMNIMGQPVTGSTIVGLKNNDQGKVIVEFSGEGPVLVGRDASDVKVSNIIFRKKVQKKTQSVVVLNSTDIEIDNCTMSGGGLAGIESVSHGNLLIKNSDITGNGWAGVFFHHQAKGLIENCHIADNERGVVVMAYPEGVPPGDHVFRQEDIPQVSIYKNVIENNKITGVSVSDGGDIDLMSNKLVANAPHPSEADEPNIMLKLDMAAVVVGANSLLTVSKNTFLYNDISVVFKDVSYGFARENTIKNSKKYGVVVTGHTSPEIMNNQISNGGTGIMLRDGTDARIEGNQIFSNTFQGIEIGDVAKPLIVSNWLIRNQQAGLYIYNHAKPHIKKNFFIENNMYGILVTTSAKPLIYHNTFYRNKRVGIWFKSKSLGFFGNNVVIGSKIGLSVSENMHAVPTIQGNCIWKNDKNYDGFYKDPTMDFSQNPLFKDPANLDFTPLPGSPLFAEGDTGEVVVIGAVDPNKDIVKDTTKDATKDTGKE